MAPWAKPACGVLFPEKSLELVLVFPTPYPATTYHFIIIALPTREAHPDHSLLHVTPQPNPEPPVARAGKTLAPDLGPVAVAAVSMTRLAGIPYRRKEWDAC
jgi:hypothetical protein